MYLGKGPKNLAQRQDELWKAGLLDALIDAIHTEDDQEFKPAAIRLLCWFAVKNSAIIRGVGEAGLVSILATLANGAP